VRHRELLTSVTTDERHAATAPLMIDRKADQDLASLVRVAGVMGDERATARLVSILLAPTTRTLRTHLSWALVQRASLPDADVIDRLDAALGEASPAQREDVCVALGALCEAGTPDAPRAEAPLTTLLRDPARPVRAVAAHCDRRYRLRAAGKWCFHGPLPGRRTHFPPPGHRHARSEQYRSAGEPGGDQ
jgi:hypothetical protein